MKKHEKEHKGHKGSKKNELKITEGDDVLVASSKMRSIDGKDGDDEIRGHKGKDKLKGGEGNDHIKGEKGDDYLAGDAGNDQLFGGVGNDTIVGGVGNDTIYGAQGKDSLNGGEGNDLLDGGQGKDVLLGSGGNDILRGGNGNDVLMGQDALAIKEAMADLAEQTSVMGASTSEPNTQEPDDDLPGGESEADKKYLEIDTLTGGPGRDLFILGVPAGKSEGGAPASSTKLYSVGGDADYALITDFKRMNDRIQLAGQASEYSIGAAPAGKPQGTAIYQGPAAQGELIAILQGVQPAGVNLQSGMFTYV